MLQMAKQMRAFERTTNAKLKKKLHNAAIVTCRRAIKQQIANEYRRHLDIWRIRAQENAKNAKLAMHLSRWEENLTVKMKEFALRKELELAEANLLHFGC